MEDIQSPGRGHLDLMHTEYTALGVSLAVKATVSDKTPCAPKKQSG